MVRDYSKRPADLPVPEDDGAADHLTGCELPSIKLPSTDGGRVDLAGLSERWILYVYPMTGQPGVALPEGWDDIPGARGCTPESCGFRDHHAELAALGAGVFGLSAQHRDEQREARDRLRLPFELLSDAGLELEERIDLPTFSVDGRTLYKRLTMIARDGRIEKTFYPIFPPDRHAADVLAWLQAHAA